MAYQIQRAPGSGHLCVRAYGPGNLTEAREIVEALRPWGTPGERLAVLFDIRALDFIPTADEARVIAEWHTAFGRTYGARMAYLAPAGAGYGVARMVEIISGLHGGIAAAFTDESAALAWLSAEAADAERSASA